MPAGSQPPFEQAADMQQASTHSLPRFKKCPVECRQAQPHFEQAADMQQASIQCLPRFKRPVECRQALNPLSSEPPTCTRGGKHTVRATMSRVRLNGGRLSTHFRASRQHAASKHTVLASLQTSSRTPAGSTVLGEQCFAIPDPLFDKYRYTQLVQKVSLTPRS